MKLITTSIGSYPRIGELKNQQRLRKAYGQRDEGKITKSELDNIQKSVTEEVIHEQILSGIDHVTDGLVSWVDPISHIAGKLSNVEIKGLLRFFDTNCYFRQPYVVGKLKWKSSILLKEYKFAASAVCKPVRVVLTGPYTLAKLSVVKNSIYKKFDKLVADYAECLAKEIAVLAKAGAVWIQIDEPSILRNPQDFSLLENALAIINKAKGSAKIILATYFGESHTLYKKFQSLPVDVLSFDFTYGGQKLTDTIVAEGTDKSLGLGLLDGRNTRLESEAEILSQLRKFAFVENDVFLNASSGLEYLPRTKACAKLKLLAKIKNMFQKESV